MFSILHRGSCSPNFDRGECHTHSVSALLLVSLSCASWQSLREAEVSRGMVRETSV